jgi:hypothetical protein
MVRVVVVVCIALVACDRGKPKQQASPAPARDARAAPTDSPPPGDAGVVDADLVDAMILAPPKPPAQQKRDCAKVAELIDNPKHEKDQETREHVAAVKKACIDAPWSATIIDCALDAKGDENPYDCPHLMLPEDQSKAWHKAMKDVFCKYNDCIPDNFTPRPPSSGSDFEDLGL